MPNSAPPAAAVAAFSRLPARRGSLQSPRRETACPGERRIGRPAAQSRDACAGGADVVVVVVVDVDVVDAVAGDVGGVAGGAAVARRSVRGRRGCCGRRRRCRRLLLELLRCSRNSTSFVRIAGSILTLVPLVPTAPGVPSGRRSFWRQRSVFERPFDFGVRRSPVRMRGDQLVEVVDQLLHMRPRVPGELRGRRQLRQLAQRFRAAVRCGFAMSALGFRRCRRSLCSCAGVRLGRRLAGGGVCAAADEAIASDAAAAKAGIQRV